MRVRPAELSDANEMVRLGAVMFASMGIDVTGDTWREEGRRQLATHLSGDLGAFVVDHPTEPGCLVASAAGAIAQRLPTPTNVTGRAGYVQWVCVDEAFRRAGLGRSVMRALLEWFDARGVAAVELHATPMAEPLYRSLGFADPGSRAMRRNAG